jgi:glycine cleavage system aminomethyltransferase T
MTHKIDSQGVARYPLGNLPVMDPATGATLVDALGRRSYTTSIAFGPSIGKNIALAYLPHEYCQLGRELQIQYFEDVYPVTVQAVGYGALYDPENTKPRS